MHSDRWVRALRLCGGGTDTLVMKNADTTL